MSTRAPDAPRAVPGAPLRLRRTVAGAGAGSFVEYYDFAVYAALAPVLSQVFFPGAGRSGGLAATFAVFAVAFVARPLGGVVWGALGDRIGRRRTLTTLIATMAAGTTAIGLLPGYAALGVGAPLLLVALRMVQGFSAGGEIMGAATLVAEHAPEGRRGFLTSFLQVSTTVATLAGVATASLLGSALGEPAMVAWGWRLPFLAAAPLGLVSVYLRRRVPEPAAFTAARTGPRAAGPLREAVSTPANRRQVWLAGGVGILQFVAFYLLLTYMPTYLASELGLGTGAALGSLAVATAVLVLAIPVAGAASDRYGRRPTLCAASLAFLAVSYPAFALISAGGPVGATLGQILLALPAAVTAAGMLATQTELFPTRFRYSGYALGMNVGNAVFGGGAPLAATGLIALTADDASPAYLLMITAVLSLLVVAVMRETAHAPLRTE